MNTLNPLSQALASHGRYGDSTLVHMNPQEVAGLQALARKHGTSMTINPQTGLPEAFSLKSFLPMIAGLALGPAGLGLSALQAGMLTGAATGLITKDPLQALLAGAGGYGGAGIGGGLSAAGATPIDPTTFSGINPSVAYDPATMGFGAAPPPATIGQGLSQAGQGFTNLFGSGPEGTAARSAFMGTPEVAANAAKGIAYSPATGVGGMSGLAKYGASAAAPLMMSDEKVEEPEGFIRPYDLDIENLSGTYDPLASSSERRQLRYQYTPREPIRIAQGGPIRYQEGGDVSSGEAASAAPAAGSPFPVSISPGMADVFRNIGHIQTLAGLSNIGDVVSSRNIRAQIEEPMMPPTESTSSFRLPPQRSDFSNISQPQAQTSTTTLFQRANVPEKIKNTNLPNVSDTQSAAFFRSTSGGNFQPFTPSGEVDMSNYFYDPKLGGFREKPPIEYSAAYGGLATSKGFKRFQEGGLASMMTPAEAATPPMDPRFLRGNGDGMSDEIPATIEGEQDALLSDGEFVIPADVVSHLGNGSSEAGAKVLYAMMDRVRKARTGMEEQAEEIDAEEFLPR